MRLADRGGRVVGELGGDFDGDSAVQPAGGRMDPLEHVAGLAYVAGGQRHDAGVDVGTVGGLLGYLIVVARTLAQRGLEDRGVRRDPYDMGVDDEVGEVAGLQSLSRQVV